MGKGESGKIVGRWGYRAEDSRLIISVWFVLLIAVMVAGIAVTVGKARGQELVPKMPSDHDLVYVVDDRGELANIPFETAKTPLNATAVAKKNRNSFVELPGERSTMNLKTVDPHIYLFVSEGPNVHPPFLVQLAVKRGARRVTAIAERGRPGYAIASEEIVKPHYRVLGNAQGQLFMEIHPRDPLVPGEYAIMGSDLSRVATFSVGR
jgi:hypothetical protein